MAEEGRKSRLKRTLGRIKDSGKTKDFLVFLVFVAIAAVFWFFMALNDDLQQRYDVRLVIDAVPDSVTFINEPPREIHVAVKDRGANLLRYKISGPPTLHLNFKDFAEGERFKVSNANLSAVLRHIFGSTSSVSSITPDSLSLIFTPYPGKRVPLKLNYEAAAAPGMVLGEPEMSAKLVNLFSTSKTDTLKVLQTEKVVLGRIDRNTTVEVPVIVPPGKRAEPSTVSVTFTVEQLVKKESLVAVEADSVPLGEDILFFPAKVKVSYYVPMSHYNDTDEGIKVMASFSEAVRASSDHVGIRIVSKAPYMSNVELTQQTVEYALVK